MCIFLWLRYVNEITIQLVFFCLCFSLKLECEKLASEKVEIQRHYVMVSKSV